MASSGKKKTTMAKLTRESRLRERRLDKQARKNARKYAAAHPEEFSDTITEDTDLSVATGEADLPAPTDETDTSARTTRTDPSAPAETESATAESVA
jgi:hypothetical protein